MQRHFPARPPHHYHLAFKDWNRRFLVLPCSGLIPILQRRAQHIQVDKRKVQQLSTIFLNEIVKYKQAHELNGAEVLSAMFEALYVLARLQKERRSEKAK